MRVQPRHSRALAHEARYVSAAADGSRIAFAGSDRRFTVVDSTLRVLKEGELPDAGAIALHPRRDVLGVSAKGKLYGMDFGGRILFEHRHRDWKDWESGSFRWFDDGGRAIAVFPNSQGVPAVSILAESGQILAQQPIDVSEDSGFFVFSQPGRERWVIWAGAGQDGQWTYWVDSAGGRLSIKEVRELNGRDHGPVAFNSTGDEFLVVVDGLLSRYAVPSLRCIGEMQPPEVEDFSLMEHAAYAGARRALIGNSVSSRLYACDLDSMNIAEEVIVEGHEPVPFSKLFSKPGGGDDLCTDLWFFETLPRSGVLTIHGRSGCSHTAAILDGPPLTE